MKKKIWKELLKNLRAGIGAEVTYEGTRRAHESISETSEGIPRRYAEAHIVTTPADLSGGNLKIICFKISKKVLVKKNVE